MGFLDKLLGSTSEAQVKKLMPMVKRINELEGSMEALTDKELRAKTDEFRARLNNGETEDDLLPEAFAVVREAAKRTIGQRHYDVQLLGGIVLHQGRIAEMKTGEGKTITETLPAYLNALSGHGVHIVTVNDYLAERDAQWMGKIYKFLGMTVGCIYTKRTTTSGGRPTPATSPTAPTTSSALTISGTTWWFTNPRWCSGSSTTP